jgi:hypothetical protein
MRVLVTGSRFFSSLPVVRQALEEVTAGHRGTHVLVHGGARGADTLAAIAAKRLGWEIECHPAEWGAPCREECRPDCRRTRDDDTTYCSAAGHYRNQHMVDLGADVVVACYKRGAANKGTTDCRRRAVAAGIPDKRVVA